MQAWRGIADLKFQTGSCTTGLIKVDGEKEYSLY